MAICMGPGLRTQNEQAEKLRIENAVSRGELLNKDASTRTFGELADALKQAVLSSDLDRRSKETFLFYLSTRPLRVRAVERAQSRLARGNGAHPDENERR